MRTIIFKMTFTMKITWTNAWSLLFYVVLLSILLLLLMLLLHFFLSNSVFFTKSAMSNLQTNSFCFIFIKCLTSKFIIISRSKIFRFNAWFFCIIVCFFLTNLLTVGILFSTVVNAAVVAKPVILGIMRHISVILAL